MVTTRRSGEQVSAYENVGAIGGVQVLERPRAMGSVSQVETQDQQKERMQKNLDKLLNYDRYAEQEMSNVKVENAEKALSDEDIRPTSTTMQFGDDIDQIREEMRKSEEIYDTNVKLNNKGKVALVLYSLAVTIILALIMLNTGVLATLSNKGAQKTAELNSVIEEYNSVQAEIDRVSSSEHVLSQLGEGWVKK